MKDIAIAVLIMATLCAAAAPQKKMDATPNDQGSEKRATVSESAITADKIEFDNKEGVILFDQNVLVSDPQFIMRSDRLIVFLESTNDVNQIMAIGNVSLTNENRSAKCDRAVYTRKDGQIVMTGNVILRQDGERSGEIHGNKMAIWLNEERMEILEGGRVQLPPDTFKKVDKNLIP